ncbi:8644_t:CDS:2 [Entrophospora sp. SA101]|nr:4545_t:CDS:2 [Entrophospora sp. SA101]CAJ0625417.1 8644_t:CDS:2 [Entrophospora sp. SA101]CAJ0825210.1 7899_t:CDS:2 [Entrophospora sp. SA101]CAJ0843584.1 10389_t:CDS:2 [Entrophospora sp. SA101]
MHITETQVRGRWNLSILCNESRPKITRKKSELYRSSSISSSFISKSNTKNNKINNSKTKFFGRIHDNDNENYINEHLIGKNYYIKPLNIYQDTRSLIDSKRINIITLDENSVSDIVVRSDDFENKDYGLHEIIKETWSNNFSAPVDEKLMNGGARVLDCGTGSGKWIVELSEIYPKSTFVGIDISTSSTPNDDVIPLNAAFFECNIIDGLPFPNDTFDYVYQHNLILAYTDMQWHDVMTELTRVIKPGGHLELVDLCFSDSKLSPTGNRITTSIANYFKSVDLSLDIVLKLPRYFEKSKEFDLINVLEKPIEIGSWGGENGEKVAECLISTWIAFKSILKTLLNVDDKGFDQLINQFYNDTRDVNNHMICKSIRIYGRKKFT